VDTLILIQSLVGSLSADLSSIAIVGYEIASKRKAAFARIAFVDAVEARALTRNSLVRRGWGSRHDKFMSIWPSAREMGIARNRSCPACKSLRKSGATLVVARRSAEIASGVNYFQKDASRQFPICDWIIARAAARNPARYRLLRRARTGKAHLQEYPQCAMRR